MLPLVTHTNKRQIWFLSNEKLHTCNRSYFRGNGMHPTNLPFTGSTWFSTSTTKPGRGSGPGRARPRHVGCAAAILPPGGGAAQPGRCLWPRPRSRAARALPCECLGHLGPSDSWAGPRAGWALKQPTCSRSRESDSPRAARATRTSRPKRASAGGLEDHTELPRLQRWDLRSFI